MMKQKTTIPAMLALADGTTFEGFSFGAQGETSGEVVFNTSMMGYQEILTDPSYVFQMITFTCPHIGNVGVNTEDLESEKIQASAMICRSVSEGFSNFRGEKSLGRFLEDQKIIGITGVDTRALVLHLRTHGAKMGVISTRGEKKEALIEKAKSLPSMEGLDLVKEVTTAQPYPWKQGSWLPESGYRIYTEAELQNRPLVVAIDYGIKRNILRLLIDRGFRVIVVPATFSAEQILAYNPAGVFLSNGPGDPAAVHYGVKTVKELLGKSPMFGICLGLQIMGLSLGGKTFKLKFGHRGANHPVRNNVSGKIEITSQNHGFAVAPETLPSTANITHTSLNDKTVEGFEVKELSAFSVQYHPEASPGPHDARYLFDRFFEMITTR